MDKKQLLEIKEKIENRKPRLSELKGKGGSLMDVLKKSWGCPTVKQAEKKLGELKKELKGLEEAKQRGIEKLENEYEF